ncbi:thioesterase family protein [Aspergillus lucknowensis]|uniref:Thioesterase-like superfamily-domain-containing protein n=1 Tax=Aspergillus lucknowensis TaxID=176173 RepID=A0ABR4LHN0_9EURO
MPSHSDIFEHAISVTALSSHTYYANLDPAWTVGNVPHGGYTTAILSRLATTHFKAIHRARFKNSTPEPIAFQISFLRRTNTGPALLTVQDMKLGLRTSTIHVTLSQPADSHYVDGVGPPFDPATGFDESAQLEDKVVGYITLSPPDLDDGPVHRGPWELHPPPPRGSNADGSVNFANLAATGRDGGWAKHPVVPIVHVGANIETYGLEFDLNAPLQGAHAGMVIDQWARLTPEAGEKAPRWTNEAVVCLADVFLAALGRLAAMELFGSSSAAAAGGGEGKEPGPTPLVGFWYPTVALNIDLKSRLPEDGVEWLYSRVETKTVRGGRADIEAVIMTEEGEVVALSNQVALVVDSARYVGKGGRKGVRDSKV